MATYEIEDPVVVGLPPVKWGWLVGLGSVLVVLGVILLARPYKAAGTLAVLVAIALIVEAVELLLDARHLPRPVLGFVLGFIYLATAIVALAWPGITLWALAVVFGVGLIVSGVVLLALRKDATRLGVGGHPLLLGILSIAAGVAALAWPGGTILVLALVFGIRVLFSGIALVATGLLLRRSI